jgi:WD40 repeat protein
METPPSLANGGEPSLGMHSNAELNFNRRKGLWKKHRRDLYRISVSCDLMSEARTVEWCTDGFVPGLGDAGPPDGDGRLKSLFLLTGTGQTTPQRQNYLEWSAFLVPSSWPVDSEDAKARLPVSSTLQELIGGEDYGGFGAVPFAAVDDHARRPTNADFGVARVVKRLYHSGAVLSARAMPLDPAIVATSSSDGSVYVFNERLIKSKSATVTPSTQTAFVSPTGTRLYGTTTTSGESAGPKSLISEAPPLRPLLPRKPDSVDVDDPTALGEEKGMPPSNRLLLNPQAERYLNAVKAQHRWDRMKCPGHSGGQHLLALRHTSASAGIPSSASSSSPSGSTAASNASVSFALGWCPTVKGVLAVGGESQLSVWDLATQTLPAATGPTATAVAQCDAAVNLPLQKDPSLATIYSVRRPINNLEFHPLDPFAIALAMESNGWAVVDRRVSNATPSKPLLGRPLPGVRSVTTVSWCPSAPLHLGFGSSDGQVGMVDLRQPSIPVLLCAAHSPTVEVTQIRFGPQRITQMGQPLLPLACCGSDGTVTLVSCLEADKGPRPIFRHWGHLGEVSDVSWCPAPSYEGLLGTVDTLSEELQLWQPRDALLL